MRYTDLLMEAATTDIAVFYGGRFQPMHSGHHQVYQDLVRKFGADNVFISTMVGKNAEAERDPFTFDEKAGLMTKMFGIPANHIIQTHPYNVDMSKAGRDPTKTAIVLVYGEKDANRLKMGYLQWWKDGEPLVTSDEAGYVYTVPNKDEGRSASDFRAVMRSDADDQKKKAVFTDFFGKFDQQVFDFIEEKLRG